MRNILFLLMLSAASVFMFGCGQSSGVKSLDSDQAQLGELARVNIYYFHGRQRCVTCLGVQELVEKMYTGNFSDNVNVGYREIDFTDRANLELADKYEIAFSSLIIASENDYTDMTEYAFVNIFRDPAGVEAMMASEINKYLKN
jgi:hypothetical protein